MTPRLKPKTYEHSSHRCFLLKNTVCNVLDHKFGLGNAKLIASEGKLYPDETPGAYVFKAYKTSYAVLLSHVNDHFVPVPTLSP